MIKKKDIYTVPPQWHSLTSGTIVACLVIFLASCGGGTSSTETPGGTPSGSRAPYTVSVNGGTFGTTPVSVSADAITIGSRTVGLEAATRIGSGHYRFFDTQEATSGPALEVHVFGRNGEYSHIQFGSWAKGTVSPNPGFRIGEEFGAFLAPHATSGLTPISNLPTAGSGTWRGIYAGYVDKEGVGVSQVVGGVDITAFFHQFGSVLIELGPPDSRLSSLAFPATPLFGSYPTQVLMTGLIRGNTFESDVTATKTLFGQTFPRGDSIVVFDTVGVGLYSTGIANSGGMKGGFFGDRGGEAGGTYQFTIGTTKAAGSFGGKLQ